MENSVLDVAARYSVDMKTYRARQHRTYGWIKAPESTSNKQASDAQVQLIMDTQRHNAI